MIMKHEVIVVSAEEIMKDRCSKYDFIDFDKVVVINDLPMQQKTNSLKEETNYYPVFINYKNTEDNFPIPKSKYHK